MAQAVDKNFVSLINGELLITAAHPIRVVTRMCDGMLAEMSMHFDEIYGGRCAVGAAGDPVQGPGLSGTVFDTLGPTVVREAADRRDVPPVCDLPRDQAPFDAST